MSRNRKQGLEATDIKDAFPAGIYLRLNETEAGVFCLYMKKAIARTQGLNQAAGHRLIL